MEIQMPPPDQQRPLVTFILMAYNQEAYIHAAIKGAFAQTYDPLEIILSDDCSGDRTFEIMQEYARSYTGPKTVSVRQNSENLGPINHFNALLNLSKGELVVIAAGDDISLPERTALSVECYLRKADRKILIHCDVTDIDIHGRELGNRAPPRQTSALEHQTRTPIIDPAANGVLTKSLAMYIGATGAISKPMIHAFEPLRFPGVYEDIAWGFRAALHNAIHYVPHALVQYRIGIGISGTGRDQNSFTTEIQQLVKSRRVNRNALRQRLIDLQTIDDNETIALLHHKFSERLALETQCVKIHDLDLSMRDILNPVFAQALLRVISSTSKISLKYIRKKVKLLSKKTDRTPISKS